MDTRINRLHSMIYYLPFVVGVSQLTRSPQRVRGATIGFKNEFPLVQVDASGRWSCVRSALLSLRALILCYFSRLPARRHTSTLLTNDHVQRKVMGTGYLLMRGSSTCLLSGLTLIRSCLFWACLPCSFFAATVPTPEQTYAVGGRFSLTLFHVDWIVADARTQALAPDLRRKVDANRTARMTQERVLKQQTEAQASHICPFRVVRPE